MMTSTTGHFADVTDMLLAYPVYASFCAKNFDAWAENLELQYPNWKALFDALLKSEEHASSAAFWATQLSHLALFVTNCGRLSKEATADAYNDAAYATIKAVLCAAPPSALSDFGILVRDHQIELRIPPYDIDGIA